MDKRRTELLELSSYIRTIDNDVTMILQSLQWDRKHLIESSAMVSCKYEQNHRVPPDKLDDHEKGCYLRSLGYSKDDQLLPEPLDTNANTLVTLSQNDIANIIDYAAKIDPGFKKGLSPGVAAPLSLPRLQQTYSSDERRALHNAAVSAVPACHDLGELVLLGSDGEAQSSKSKSRAEILAELRDMKRRRVKYRGAAKTRNYSDVLRDVIATQMEHYEVQNDTVINNYDDTNKSNADRSKSHQEVYIKKEPMETDKTYLKDSETKRDSAKEYEKHHRDLSRDKSRHRDNRDETRYRDQSRDKLSHGDWTDETRHRDQSRDASHHRDSRDKTRHRDRSRDKSRHRESRDETRNENYRDEKRQTHRSRDQYKGEKRYDDYKRDSQRGGRRHEDERDRQPSSSKGKTRDGNDRSSDRYKNDSRKKDYKDYKSSKNSEVRYKREDYDSYEKSYRDDKHKRYYDFELDISEVHKRIKKENTD